MSESVFNGTVKEGLKRRFTIINEHDLNRYLEDEEIEHFEEALNKIVEKIEYGRESEGKKPFNSYVVINLDEPYVNDIIRVMQRNGHWEGRLDVFSIEDIDGCEFVKSNVIGNMMISFHQDFDGYYTGKIHVVYPDGSHALISRDEAQEKLDSGKWIVIR